MNYLINFRGSDPEVRQTRSELTRRMLDGIELKHLRFALLAAELRSFAKAGAQLKVKSATLSNHISYLERRLGAVLFQRSTRGVAPTQAGEVFLESARRVLDELEGLHEKTRAFGNGSAGTLAVGFITSITAGNLRSTLFAFEDAYPDIELRGSEDERSILLNMLDTGRLDIVIISGAVPHPEARRASLWSERVLAALPSEHWLAARDYLHWSDLEGQTIIAPRNTADDIQSMVSTRLGKPGEPATILLSDVSREVVLGAVAAGRGISIVTAGSAGLLIDNVVYRELHDAGGQHLLNFSAYWRPENRNPSLRRFVEFLRSRYSFPLPVD